MADFTLTVKTDSSAELLDIVSKIAGSMPLPAPHAEAKVLMEQRKADVREAMSADVELLAGVEATHEHPVGEILPAAPGAPAVLGETPERDGHGIKRDDRIHANAADPFKADGTWKRRKNVPDEQYEEIHLELVREARAAGLYTGPAIPELELESRVEDTEQQTPPPVSVTVENNTDAQLEVTQEPEVVTITAVAPPAPAPAPVPVPAAPAAPGMSAEATPTMQQVVVKLFHAAGVNAMQEALKAMKLSHVGEATPQQLRDLHSVAENIEKLKLGDADKPAKGPEHTRETLAALGYVA